MFRIVPSQIQRQKGCRIRIKAFPIGDAPHPGDVRDFHDLPGDCIVGPVEVPPGTFVAIAEQSEKATHGWQHRAIIVTGDGPAPMEEPSLAIRAAIVATYPDLAAGFGGPASLARLARYLRYEMQAGHSSAEALRILTRP